MLIPRARRGHVAAIYAFARIADDFADEGYETDGRSSRSVSDRLTSLDNWEAQLLECYRGRANHPVFIALRETVSELSLPVELLRDLISAFKQDVVKRRYGDFDEVLDYCSRSANPVGRLVLRLFGYADPERDALSDRVCTALQLANFWQDIGIDLAKDRIYLPLADLERFDLSEDDIRQRRFSGRVASLMDFEVKRTRALFREGAHLPEMVSGRLKYELRMTWHGGMRVLEKIEDMGFDTLNSRPHLATADKLKIAFRSLRAQRVGSLDQ